MQEIALTIAAALMLIGTVLLTAPHILRLPRAMSRRVIDRPAARQAATRATSVGARPLPALPERLSRDEQWSRAARIISDSVERAARIEDLQRSAAQQLDSATYAIQRLWAELGSVVPDAAERVAAERTVVHTMAPLRPAPTADAALAA